MKKGFAILLAGMLLLAGCAPAEEQPGVHPSVLVAVTTDAPFAQATLAPAGEAEPQMTSAPEETSVPRAEEPDDSALVPVAEYIPGIREALAYATVNNFAGEAVYDFQKAYLRYGTVKKLAAVSAELAEDGLGLMIWDAFRPVSAQARLWEICPDATFVSHPVTGRRAHCRGSAVDVTLVNLETGEELSMPTGYDNFTAYADRDYSDCSAETAENAHLLEDTMQRHGFVPYEAEWWHFADEEEYPVDEYFDPAMPSAWEANCDAYITLRREPDGEEAARIPTGGVMELLQWQGKYARVRWEGREGWVAADYIRPTDDAYFLECLDTVEPTHVYTHGAMLQDMDDLCAAHPGIAERASIGKSEGGRDIPVLRIGRENARYHVLLQGAIHGREHLTAWLIMAMADYWLDHGLLGYGDVCWHLIPMTNPDGVAIAQGAAEEETWQDIFRKDRESGYTDANEADYAARWKANGRGVDLNRNFDAGWDALEGRDAPSAQQYRGEAPFSEAESRALRDYTLQYGLDATVSYHATGSLIYYTSGGDGATADASAALADAVSRVTGYAPDRGSGTVGGGYRDWAEETAGVPSVTVEVGCREAALAEREIYSIFVRNYRLLPEIVRWMV